MANNRIFYAVQAVALKTLETASNGSTVALGGWGMIRGLQSVGMTTNIALEQVFQLGQLELYDNVEQVPEIEVTLNKVLDGHKPMYLMSCNKADDENVDDASTDIGPVDQLVKFANTRRTSIALGIWKDSQAGATGTAPEQKVVCTGMYVSSVSYTLGVDGNFTEDVTLVGNNKTWSGSDYPTNNDWFDNSTFDAKEKAKITRRWSLDVDNSTLPTGNKGIPGTYGVDLHFTSIRVSVNLGREAINELGRRAPYYRYASFPVEVTSEFEVVATRGDGFSASDFSDQTGCGLANATNVADKTIVVRVCAPVSPVTQGDDPYRNDRLKGYTFDLGASNKLTSVNYSGGDTGGGNATITYSFQTFNSLGVYHE